MKDLIQSNHFEKIRELSYDEVVNVSGGFWGALVAIAAAALAAGCATMPKKKNEE